MIFCILLRTGHKSRMQLVNWRFGDKLNKVPEVVSLTCSAMSIFWFHTCSLHIIENLCRPSPMILPDLKAHLAHDKECPTGSLQYKSMSNNVNAVKTPLQLQYRYQVSD